MISAILIAVTLLGAVFGALLLPEDWSLARRIAGGTVAGVGIGLLMTMTKVFGD